MGQAYVARQARGPGYIRSGAITPHSPRPLAMTWRVAAHSQSLAMWMGMVSSSARGRTRQES